MTVRSSRVIRAALKALHRGARCRQSRSGVPPAFPIHRARAQPSDPLVSAVPSPPHHDCSSKLSGRASHQDAECRRRASRARRRASRGFLCPPRSPSTTFIDVTNTSRGCLHAGQAPLSSIIGCRHHLARNLRDEPHFCSVVHSQKGTKGAPCSRLPEARSATSRPPKVSRHRCLGINRLPPNAITRALRLEGSGKVADNRRSFARRSASSDHKKQPSSAQTATSMKTKTRHRKSYKWRKSCDTPPVAKCRRPKIRGKRNPRKAKHKGGRGL